MIEFNDDIVKDEKVFNIVLDKIRASGVTTEDEAVEILMRDYRFLFRELTEAEMKLAARESLDSQIEAHIANMNRKSIKEKGHPYFVCQRINGVKHFKKYAALTAQEIAELQSGGVIL